MSSSANGPGSPSSLPRLGPTWSKGGRGFQPPPPAESLTRSRSGSAGSSGSESKPNVNKFAVLDDDDDVNSRPPNSRSEALRSFHRSSSGGPKPTGRSLADLAARTPSTGISRSSSAPFRDDGGGAGGGGHGGRFSSLNSGDGEGSHAKVIRITREKLLALRKPPGPNDPNPPEVLKHLEGSIVLSSEPQDPVCWDNFDPDEIWDQVPRVGRSSSIGGPKGPLSSRLDSTHDDKNRRASTGADRGGGRWQRGVALPPPDEGTTRTNKRSSQVEAENPNDLWDDPKTGPTGAASDFSAFGTIPDEPNDSAGGGGGGPRRDDAFDFEKMAEATNRFDMERRGSKGSDALSEGEDEPTVHAIQVDPHRPLASMGTTIQSGSGDDVNVFEDFDTPGETEETERAAVKGAKEDTSASSRLMKMIGVSKEGTDDQATRTTESETADAEADKMETAPTDTSASKAVDSWDLAGNGIHIQDSKSAVIPSNPWGSLMGATSNQQQQSGMDLAARMEAEQKARDAHIAAEMERRKAQEAERLRRQQEEEAELLRRRQEEEEAKRRASKSQPPSQVELVLMERISTFLENSWGRSDLVSILSTLHVEDSRVIPLLGNVDALRALIARHPSRIGLRHDPALGSEMAVLLLTNAQWAKQEQMARQEEMQQRMEQQRREEAMRQASQKPQVPVVSADAPWYYSDPQNIVQGPFRGEEMRQWLEAGYFKGDLPISQQERGPFVPLQALFADLSVAFRVPGDSTDNDAAAQQAAEEERRAREEEERRAAEKRAQEEAASRAAEIEQREREAVAKKRATAKEQTQSAQLKMMLGMGRSGGSGELADEPGLEQPAEAQPKKKEKAQSRPKQQQPQPSAPAPAASPAWGGASSAAPSRKSIAEIQQEEARAAARQAMERKHNPPSSSGWANVAASKGGSTGWQSGTVKPTPAATVTNANANLAAASRTMRPSQASSSRQTSASQRSRGSTSDKAVDDFGATMPPALENWCKDQLKKLSGSDDLTLVSFCMTLSDGDEIRQYLTAYLGSTPQVNNFATEFIARKNGGKGKQDEWESATKGKKGKKKK